MLESLKRLVFSSEDSNTIKEHPEYKDGLKAPHNCLVLYVFR